MKIQALSDLHIEFEGHALEIPDVGADVLVLAGDIGRCATGVEWAAHQAERLGLTCIYVPGNHEFYHSEHSQALEAMRAAARGTRVSVLDNESIVIDGVRFLCATLWTDLSAYAADDTNTAAVILERSLNDYRLISVTDDDHHRALQVADTVRWNRESVAWLETELHRAHVGKTVVITHHGPCGACQHARHPLDWISNGFHSQLERLVKEDYVSLWIYGHTHSSLDTRINGVRLVSNQRGYPHETVPGGFNPGKLLIV